MGEYEGVGNFPPGFRFTPSPQELVKFYLRPRLLNQPLPYNAIRELNLYDFHPRDILGNTPAGKHLYLFTPRQKKYPKGRRPARGTNGGGYWKASGKDKIIVDEDSKEIGRKKSLVFHEGHHRNGTRTNWLMQEYTIHEFWFPTDQSKDKLGALALCELYLRPTPNQPRDGEFQVDEQEIEEEGPASPFLDNIFADRRVRPRPPPWNHGNDQGEAPVASTSGCPVDAPLAIDPITVRPDLSMPSMGYNNLQSHNMVLIPQSSLGPGGPRALSYSRSHQIRPLPAHCQPGHVVCSSGFGNDGGLLQPGSSYLPNGNTIQTMSPVQPDVLVHSCYCSCAVSASSRLQFGSSSISSFRNQLMPSSQYMPHGEMSSPEFGAAAASSAQYELPPQRMPPPPQFYLEASQLMPSASESSPQKTLWPLPSLLK